MPQKTWAIGEEVLAADFNTYVQSQVVPRFATVAARDTGWPAATAGAGAVCITNDTATVWAVNAAATTWQAVAGKLPWFRYQGGAPGHNMGDGQLTVATFSTGTLTGTAGLAAAGVFTCPAAYAGRWRFDYAAQWGPNAIGIRQTYLNNSVTAQSYASWYLAAGATQNGNFYLTASVEIVMSAGHTLGLVMLHNMGATTAVNSLATSYFQGQYVGPP